MDLSWMLTSGLIGGLYGQNTLVVTRTSGSGRRSGDRPLARADDALRDLQALTDEAHGLAVSAADEDATDGERADIADQIAAIEAEIADLVDNTSWAFEPLLDGTGEPIQLWRGDQLRTLDLGDLSLGGADALEDADDFANRAREYESYEDDLDEARDAVASGIEFLEQSSQTTTVTYLPVPSVQQLLVRTLGQISQLGSANLGSVSLLNVVVD